MNNVGKLSRARSVDQQADAVNGLAGNALSLLPGPLGAVGGFSHSFTNKGSKAAQKEGAFGNDPYTGKPMDASTAAANTGYRARKSSEKWASQYCSDGTAETLGHVVGATTTLGMSATNAAVSVAYGAKDLAKKLVPPKEEMDDYRPRELTFDEAQQIQQREADRDIEERANSCIPGDPQMSIDPTLRPPPEEPGVSE